MPISSGQLLFTVIPLRWRESEFLNLPRGHSQRPRFGDGALVNQSVANISGLKPFRFYFSA
jgi:hypothetical protein